MADMTSDEFEQKLQELGFTSTPAEKLPGIASTDDDQYESSLPSSSATSLQSVPQDQQNAALLTPESPEEQLPPSPNASFDPNAKPQLFSSQPPVSETEETPTPLNAGPQTKIQGPNTPVTTSSLPPSTPYSPKSLTPANPLEDPSVNDQAIQTAQKQSALRSLIGNVGEGLGTFSALASGQKFDPSFYKDIQKQANQPVEDIQARRDAMVKSLSTASMMTDLAVKNMNAQEQQNLQDPNSPQSKGLKNLIQHYEPWLAKDPSWSTMSGTDAMNATKYLETEAKIQASKAQRDASNSYREQQAETRKAQFNQQQQDKISKEVNALTQNSRSALGSAGRSLVNADRALDTLNQPVITNQQLNNISADVAGLYNNGQATVSGTQHNQYDTLYSKVQGLLQQLTGQPQDAVPDAIRQQIKDTVQQMRSISSNVAQKNLEFIKKSHPDFTKTNPNYFDDVAKGLANETSQTSGNTTQQQAPTTPGQSFSPDVVQYAQTHGITPAQALSIKQKRTGIQ